MNRCVKKKLGYLIPEVRNSSQKPAGNVPWDRIGACAASAYNYDTDTAQVLCVVVG